MSKSIAADITEDTTGDPVAFTAPTTVFLEGTPGRATVVLQARIAGKDWGFIHQFGFSPVNVTIEGAYELRHITSNASAETDISINATE